MRHHWSRTGATDESCDIKSLNPSAHTLALDNGPTFIAPPTAKLSNFKVGERVTVAYSMRGSGLG
jgi:hypothetical protein